MLEMPEDAVTVQEAARYFEVTDRTIRNWIRAGHFPNAYSRGLAYNSGYMIPVSDINAFDAQRRARPDDK